MMRFELSPIDGLADAVPSIRIVDCPAAQPVTLTVATTDAAGNAWASETSFQADAAGTVDPARDAPAGGGYATVDASGPIWSMQFANPDAAPTMFAAPSDALAFVLGASGAGEPVKATMQRRWSGPGVTETEVRGEGFVGALFRPASAEPAPAVALIPGTTGPAALAPTAALLASHSYAAMVVSYMGAAGLPSTLCEIPLEAVASGIRSLAAQPGVNGDRLGLFCASVGTEGGLGALAEIQGLSVRAVVALSPSSVIWQGMGEGRPPAKPSWTLGGKPLPWVPTQGGRFIPQLIKNAIVQRLARRPRATPLHLLPAYAAGLRDSAAVERAAIRVEQIAAPILFISGDDDQMWPSSEMVGALWRRREAAGRSADDQRLRFVNAGQIIRPPITPTAITWTKSLAAGGTPAGSAASAQTWPAILEFFSTHLAG